MKKYTVLNASPRKSGSTAALIETLMDAPRQNGDAVTTFILDKLSIHGCQACEVCRHQENSFCIQNDDMGPIYKSLQAADVIVIGMPVYMSLPSAQAIAVLNRLYANAYVGKDGSKSRKISGKQIVTIYSQGAGTPDYYTDTFDLVDKVFSNSLDSTVIKRFVCAGGQVSPDVEKEARNYFRG